jgi:WD40 repeat protein
LRHGEEDKRLYGLAAMELDSDVRFAFAGQYGKIMVANLEGRPAKPYGDFDEWYVPFSFSGNAYTHCLKTVREGILRFLVSGTEQHLAVWNFMTGEILAKKENAHQGPVTALALGSQAGRVRIASVGEDRFLRVWNMELDKITEVEIGEPIHAAIWLDANRIAVGTGRGLLALEFAPNTLN